MERQRNKGMHYIINANRCKKNALECIHDHRIMYLTEEGPSMYFTECLMRIIYHNLYEQCHTKRWLRTYHLRNRSYLSPHYQIVHTWVCNSSMYLSYCLVFLLFLFQRFN